MVRALQQHLRVVEREVSERAAGQVLRRQARGFLLVEQQQLVRLLAGAPVRRRRRVVVRDLALVHLDHVRAAARATPRAARLPAAPGPK